MKTATALILSFTTFLLTACINLDPEPDNTRRFALGPVAPAEVLTKETAAEALTLYLMPPHLPTYLNRKELLYRSADGEVVALPAARWAEPLADGVARALAHYLGCQAHIAVAGYYPWPQPAGPHARLTLKFSRLDAAADGLFQIVAHWTLRLPDGSRRSGVIETDDVPWQIGAAEPLVTAHNQALKALAASLAEALQ